MPGIAATADIADKFARRAASASGEYLEGVKNPRTDWATATRAANDAYKQGITKSLQDDAFAKGVARAGTDKWKDAAIKKGPGRYAEGVAGAGEAYRVGFEPYREVIANTTLPARKAKGDPANIQRVSKLAAALHEKKLQLRGR